MAQADPFLHPIPQKILLDPELKPFFEYFVRWAHDIWVRSGGGDDSIISIENRDVFDSTLSSAYFSDVNESIADLNKSFYETVIPHQYGFNAVTKSNDYTASSWDWINAKNGAKIKFPLNPDTQAELVIRVGDKTTIPIDGNGRNINGSSKGKIKNKGTSLRFKYFIDDNEWFAI